MLLDDLKMSLQLIDQRSDALLLLIKNYREEILTNYKVYVDLSHDIRFEDEKVIVLHPQVGKDDKFQTIGMLINTIGGQLDAIVNQCRELQQIRQMIADVAYNLAGDAVNEPQNEEEQL